MYNVRQIREVKCLCSISRKVVLKEGMMLNLVIDELLAG